MLIGLRSWSNCKFLSIAVLVVVLFLRSVTRGSTSGHGIHDSQILH